LFGEETGQSGSIFGCFHGEINGGVEGDEADGSWTSIAEIVENAFGRFW
jgi:hypothetical protein